MPEGGGYPQVRWKGELPFGMTRTDTNPWPFREPRHAKPPRDGKAKASQMETIWVSMLDLERGLSKLSDDELSLLYKYYLFQTHTLEELAVELQVDYPMTVLRRANLIVKHLTKVMENDYDQNSKRTRN